MLQQIMRVRYYRVWYCTARHKSALYTEVRYSNDMNKISPKDWTNDQIKKANEIIKQFQDGKINAIN